MDVDAGKIIVVLKNPEDLLLDVSFFDEMIAAGSNCVTLSHGFSGRDADSSAGQRFHHENENEGYHQI